jgi:hypothetical protein
MNTRRVTVPLQRLVKSISMTVFRESFACFLTLWTHPDVTVSILAKLRATSVNRPAAVWTAGIIVRQRRNPTGVE